MSLRRLAVAVPGAALVALVVHLARFGTSHVPGMQNAAMLALVVGGLLAATVLGALLDGALGPQRRSRKPAVDLGEAAAVALAGFGAYAALEASEGHVPLAGFGLLPLAALLLGALATTALLAFAGRLLAHAGAQLAELAGEALAFAPPPAYQRIPAGRATLALGRRPRQRRGRAPPPLG
ncbi:MAG: hypothetical protein ACREM2_06115 [Vulcanimicrobiaceae bacterium]